MRGQASIEYLALVGIVLAFIIPVWLYMTSLNTQTGNELSLSYAKNAAKQIADVSSLVYSQGPPAKVSLKLYIPSGVINASLQGNNIVFNVSVGNSYTDVFAVSSAPLNGTLPTEQGTYNIAIQAVGSYVQINPA